MIYDTCSGHYKCFLSGKQGPAPDREIAMMKEWGEKVSLRQYEYQTTLAEMQRVSQQCFSFE